MKIAVIQFGAGNNKEKNVSRAYSMAERAAKQGAEFILLPEVFVYRGSSDTRMIKSIAEPIPGATTDVFASLAGTYGVYILLGSIYERTRGRKVYNTSVLIDRRGSIAATYRKIHLFDATVGRKTLCESKTFLKGKDPVMTRVGSFKAGMSICFDARFSELYLQYARAGADMLLVPSAFTKKTGALHWKHLLAARAIEHQCYVLAPNQIGKDERGIESYGHSMIIDPSGKILAEGQGSRDQILYARIDRKEILRVRKAMKMKR